MELNSIAGFKVDDLRVLVLVAIVAAGTSLAVFVACSCWFLREQRRLQKKILKAMANAAHESEELFLTGRDAASYGELVAQFKVNQGKQIVSILESDGKRFIHIDGELSTLERTKMVRYLKSEGFMS